MATWQEEEWPAIQKEQARQKRVLHEWLAARGGEPPSPVFQVPGVDGFWCIGADRAVRRADVAVTSDDPEKGGYFLFDPERVEPYQ